MEVSDKPFCDSHQIFLNAGANSFYLEHRIFVVYLIPQI
jgi:hypothetical protein